MELQHELAKLLETESFTDLIWAFVRFICWTPSVCNSAGWSHVQAVTFSATPWP